jgi:2-methylisocitrate lyase-like PEP mutase family enzyme
VIAERHDRSPSRTERFRHLHESGCFVIPNPWDVGSARALVGLGFQALATTSSGAAWSIGRADHHVTLEDALAHFRTIAASVDVPVNGRLRRRLRSRTGRCGGQRPGSGIDGPRRCVG